MESTPEDQANLEQPQQYDNDHKDSIESQEPLVADERDAYANDDIDVPIAEEDHNELEQHLKQQFAQAADAAFDHVPINAVSDSIQTSNTYLKKL